MADRPMWCDDFDMDLPKVVPGARAVFGELGDVILWTHSTTTHGVINCPSGWHDQEGIVSFFGFRDPAKPASYWTNAPVVQCTVWEAIRDLWVHNHVLILEGQAVWNAYSIVENFETIMMAVRRWGAPNHLVSPNRKRIAQLRTLMSLRVAAARIGELHAQYRSVQ